MKYLSLGRSNYMYLYWCCRSHPISRCNGLPKLSITNLGYLWGANKKLKSLRWLFAWKWCISRDYLNFDVFIRKALRFIVSLSWGCAISVKTFRFGETITKVTNRKYIMKTEARTSENFLNRMTLKKFMCSLH